jgi:GH15 family glucan-1,4-alpha-glucosidase
MSDVPLDQHALLSDCGAAALVTSGGSVDWLCLPRFDSPAVFARLLDDDAGHFLIAPVGADVATSRRYRPFGLVLETVWEAAAGTLVVTDAMALGHRDRGHGLGRTSPGVLLRLACCTRGAVEVRVSYAPRPEFGLVHPLLTGSAKMVIARGGATRMALQSPIALQVEAATATAVVTLTEGQDLAFALTYSTAWDPPPVEWSSRQIRRGLKSTESSWRSWSRLHQSYEGPHRALVHHSGVVLQGLTYARSGAVVAAPTTSLPEGEGSGRTWDYRYTWVRDASMTLQGLWIAACPEESGRFFSFLATAASNQLERGLDLQVMFGIGGEHDLSERGLGHLTGWRGSGPVRVGNGAWGQRQLDVYGALLDAAYTVREKLSPLDDGTRTFLVSAVDAAATRWQEDDQGIWEIRGAPRPFLHSKLMCWVALDRGLAMTRILRPPEGKAAAWSTTREELREAIITQGWSDQVGAFTQAFGSDELDASALLLAIVGFLPADDDRLLATIDAVERHLTDEHGLVYRYQGGDDFDCPEGSFLLCTFWLAHALAITGQIERAETVLGRAADCANDLGLFSEQIDTISGEFLGNFPQAFSHLGLITAANALAEAQARSASSVL